MATYRIGRLLGRGGMAEVYAATAVTPAGREFPAAVKVMRPEFSCDPGFAAMFEKEASLSMLMDHPNIVQVYDSVRGGDGCLHLIMELVDGTELGALLSERSFLPSESIEIVRGLLAGLDYAHTLERNGRALGLVHRDISPQNIMITEAGVAKILDFGIAKAVAATQVPVSGSFTGKVGYMSPEQAHGELLDARSDLFSVGVVFYELLTGRRLFHRSSDAETLAFLLTAPIPPPSEVIKRQVNELGSHSATHLDSFVMTLLQRDRAHRFMSAEEAKAALLGIVR